MEAVQRDQRVLGESRQPGLREDQDEGLFIDPLRPHQLRQLFGLGEKRAHVSHDDGREGWFKTSLFLLAPDSRFAILRRLLDLKWKTWSLLWREQEVLTSSS